MKKLLLLCMPIIGYSQSKKKQFIAECDLTLPGKNQKIYLEYASFSEKEMVTYTDSAFLTDGKCTFTGKISEPSKATIYAYLYGHNGQKSSLVFFLAHGKTTITSKTILGLATVRGTDEAIAFTRLMEEGKKFDRKKLDIVDSLIAYDSKNNKEGMERIKTKYKLLQKEIQDSVYIPFYLRHLNSAVGVYALTQIAANINDPEKTQKLLSQLSPGARKLQAAIQLNKKVEGAMRTAVGVQALDFTMGDAEGKSMSLSSFKGKYVLVDFWASWCMPCRAESPNLVAAYAKYREKGFTILGVALEREGGQEKWHDAIAKDSLTWTQVSDFRYWDNIAAKQFYVSSIPFNFLLDPQGRIIARDIRGAELNETLSKLFK